MSLRSNMARHASALAGLAGIAGLALAGIGGAAEAQEWSLEEAAKPYAGETIRCVGDGYAPFVAYEQLAEKFTERTGIEVVWEVGDVGAGMLQKVTADALNDTGVYDCVELPSLNVGLWIARDFVKPIHELLADEKLHNPEFDPFTAYVPGTLAFSSIEDGQIYGLPYHFIPRFMVVRTDIATNPTEQANFKTVYGYDLPLKPATWQQYRDVAEFFTRNAGEELAGETLDEDFYGTAVSMKRHWATQYDFELFLNGFGGYMFEGDGPLETAANFASGDEITFDSASGVEALEYWLSLLDYVPPGYIEYTWDNTYSDMCEGRLYTYPTWGDTTPYLEDPEGCPKIAGKLTYYPVPGTNLTGAEGQAWIIPTSSKHQEATFLFLQWLASFEVQKECQKIGCTSPRQDVWFDSEFDGIGAVEITRWLIENNKVIARSHPPALSEISTILIDNVHEAGLGEQTAEEALNNAAAKSREAMGQ
jgi:multiple sugar transport system substrate-binding protein